MEAVTQADKVFHSLAAQLGTQKFLMGDRPTELDALAFGHLYTILTTRLDLIKANSLQAAMYGPLEYAQEVRHSRRLRTEDRNRVLQAVNISLGDLSVGAHRNCSECVNV